MKRKHFSLSEPKEINKGLENIKADSKFPKMLIMPKLEDPRRQRGRGGSLSTLEKKRVKRFEKGSKLEE